MKVLITGSNGFIGKNLDLHLAVRKDIQVQHFTRSNDFNQLRQMVDEVDFVFHLAGINRPIDSNEFRTGNVLLTEELCNALASLASDTGRKVPIIYSSSMQSGNGSEYGASKIAAEKALLRLQQDFKVPVHIFRLPNVFGKWSRQNYNSVVATFCHNVAHELPIKIHDPATLLTLVYVDDVVKRFIEIMDGADFVEGENNFEIVNPQYTITVGALAKQIYAFKDSRSSLVCERVGTGLVRALYSTYISHLPTKSFAYQVPSYKDNRGIFVEVLKTPDCGQFSYFSALPGVTRGGHYHHSKTEKFIVIKGNALFRFRHMYTNEEFELIVDENTPAIVETIPGWAHDITNIGSDTMLVMLWANELFDRNNPDTYEFQL